MILIQGTKVTRRTQNSCLLLCTTYMYYMYTIIIYSKKEYIYSLYYNIMHTTCIIYMYVDEKEERKKQARKKEASKVKQTRQSNTASTPKAVTFPIKNELPQVGLHIRTWMIHTYIYDKTIVSITEPPTCGEDHPYNLLQFFRIFLCISVKLSDHAPFV